MTMNFCSGWYVLYVKSRCEKKVNDLLQHHNLKSYLPLINKVNQWSDRKKVVQVPLFSSYVFVYSENQSEFTKALSIDGACCYIRFGKEYARVREQEMKNIKLFLDFDLNEIETGLTLPSIGEIVKFQYGPLAGLECEVAQIKNKKKVVVHIKSIHTNITATIPANYLMQSNEMFASTMQNQAALVPN